jgi:cobalamin biosynthesis Mg chelatase CobN
MPKVPGFAIAVAVALLLAGMSCSGPILKSRATSAPAAQLASSSTPRTAVANVMAALPTTEMAMATTTTSPSTQADSTQPAADAPPSPYAGVMIFALFVVALLITVWFLNFIFSVGRKDGKP